MKVHQAVYPVQAMCRILEVSRSGYYQWLKRKPSDHAKRDTALQEQIRDSHEKSDRTDGRPRVHADLKAAGERVGPKRVARLMREAGIEGVSRRRRSSPPGGTERSIRLPTW